MRELAPRVDLFLVVGARNSSNSNRLREIAADTGVATYLIEDASHLEPQWLDGVEAVGITAGASTPEELVLELIDRLRSYRDIQLEVLDGEEENVQFKLPEELRNLPVARIA